MIKLEYILGQKKLHWLESISLWLCRQNILSQNKCQLWNFQACKYRWIWSQHICIGLFNKTENWQVNMIYLINKDLKIKLIWWRSACIVYLTIWLRGSNHQIWSGIYALQHWKIMVKKVPFKSFKNFSVVAEKGVFKSIEISLMNGSFMLDNFLAEL